MGFHQARQARAPRLPRVGRAAACGYVIGVGLSQLLYPSVRTDLFLPAAIDLRGRGGKIAVLDDVPIRVRRVRGESGNEAEARMLWAVRFLMGIAEGGAHE